MTNKIEKIENLRIHVESVDTVRVNGGYPYPTMIAKFIGDKVDMLIDAHNAKAQENYDIDELQARIARLEDKMKSLDSSSLIKNELTIIDDQSFYNELNKLELGEPHKQEELIGGNWYHVFHSEGHEFIGLLDSVRQYGKLYFVQIYGFGLPVPSVMLVSDATIKKIEPIKRFSNE
jgi:hypothetical protein